MAKGTGFFQQSSDVYFNAFRQNTSHYIKIHLEKLYTFALCSFFNLNVPATKLHTAVILKKMYFVKF